MVLQHVIHNFPLYHKLARDKKEGERGDKGKTLISFSLSTATIQGKRGRLLFFKSGVFLGGRTSIRSSILFCSKSWFDWGSHWNDLFQILRWKRLRYIDPRIFELKKSLISTTNYSFEKFKCYMYICCRMYMWPWTC